MAQRELNAVRFTRGMDNAMRDAMTISVSYTFDRRDVRQSLIMGMQARPAESALVIGLFVILPWSGAIFAIVMWAQGFHIKLYEPLLLLVSPPLAALGFEHSMFRTMRKMPMLQGELTCTFSDADVQARGRGFENRFEWNSFTRCHSSARGIFILAGRMPLLQIPERALSASSRRDLRALMTAKGLQLTGTWNVGGN